MLVPQFIESIRNGFELLFEQTNDLGITWTSEIGWGNGGGAFDILNYSQRALPTKSGNVMNGFEALAISAFFGAARMIAEDIAKLPINIFTLDAQGNKVEINRGHAIYSVISLSPDGKRTAQEFWEVLIVWCLVWGNGYALIDMDENGELRSLQLIKPTRVSLRKHRGEITYRVFKNVVDDFSSGQPDEFSDMEMFHLRGIGDEDTGWPIVNFGRESLGITLATQTLQANMFSNGMNLGGTLETDAKLEPDHREGMGKEWSATYGGVNNINKTAILDDGLKYKPYAIKATDAELLETRKFQISEVARWFRIQPHKLGLMDKASLDNIEQENLKYLNETLSPWMNRIINNIERKLLFFDPNIIVEYDTKELTMTDSETRAKFWSDLIDSGVATPNMASKDLGLPTHPEGDKYYMSQNTKALEEIGVDVDLKRIELEERQKGLDEPDEPDENTDHDDDDPDKDDENTGHKDENTGHNTGHEKHKKENTANKLDITQDVLGSGLQYLLKSALQIVINRESKHYKERDAMKIKHGDKFDESKNKEQEKRFNQKIVDNYIETIEPYLTKLDMAMPKDYFSKWIEYRAVNWEDEKAMLMANDLIKHYMQISNHPSGLYTLKGHDGRLTNVEIDEKGVLREL